MSKDKFEWDDNMVVEAIEWWEENKGLGISPRTAMLRTKAQPKEPERIEIVKGVWPCGDGKYSFVVNRDPAYSKIEALRPVIERFLNDDTVEPFGIELKMISKDYYDNLVNKKYTEKDLEDAFNAGAQRRKISHGKNYPIEHFRLEIFQDYLNQLKSK